MTTTDRRPALPFLGHRDRLRSLTEDDAVEEGQYLMFADGADLRLLPVGPDAVRIGRSPACDVVLDDPTVSRRHATLLPDGDAVRLHDDCSTNGTSVNGRRISGAVDLADGDVVFFGRATVVFRDTTPVCARLAA